MTPAPGGWVSQALAMALALGLVLGLAWLVLRALRRLQPALASRPGEVPVVLHGAALGPRERLVLVRHRGREFLLGVSAGGVQLIDRWDGDAGAHPPSTRTGEATGPG